MFPFAINAVDIGSICVGTICCHSSYLVDVIRWFAGCARKQFEPFEKYYKSNISTKKYDI